MGNTCSICRRGDVAAIDEVIVGGQSLRNIAQQFGLPDHTALYRHREAGHIPSALVALQQAETSERALSLLENVQQLQREAMAILESAKQAGKLTTALAAIGQASKQLELIGKLTGELDERPQQQTINLFGSVEMQHVLAVIWDVLAPHPEIRAELARRLQTETPQELEA